MKTASIIDWQKRFFAQPHVWCVLVRDPETGNYEHTGHFYDSKEAAEIEVAFRGGKGKVQGSPLHTLELSKERWAR